jgi:rare lipoprotein A
LRQPFNRSPYFGLIPSYVAPQYERDFILKKSILAVVLLAFTFVAPAKALTVGWASFYKTGRITANGEAFKPGGLTAAHRNLPFGTVLKVTNLRNGKSVLVRVNDRGPFIKGRILDLSLGAAKVIGLTNSGVGKISFVRVR